MSIIVFWLAKPDPLAFFPNLQEPQCATYGSTELGPALKRVEQLRRAGHAHVCISSELDDSVGKAGVDAVVNGKTPDGIDYTWKKRR